MDIIGWGVAILLAIYLKFAPVGECDKCTHCRLIRIKGQEKQNKLSDELAHKLGFVNPEECRCSRCKK